MAEKASRAKQFMPFAALTGYYDLVKERERIVEPRRERSEEENRELSQKVSKIRKGCTVKIKYYYVNAYEIIEGYVSQIDFTMRYLKINKTEIHFDDIYNVMIL